MQKQIGNELQMLGEIGPALHIGLSGAVAHDARAADPFVQLGGSQVYSRAVLIDLSKCHYINSSGVAWLLVHHRRFQEAGGKLVLHSAPPVVMQIFSLMKMELVLSFCHDLAEAERLISDPPQS